MMTILLKIFGIITLWVWPKWSKRTNIIVTLVLSIMLFVYVANYLYNVKKIRPVMVVGRAMMPSYGNRMFVTTKLINDINIVKRGDVLVFNGPSNSQYIKRVIGMSNERILIKNGGVFVNNNKLDESGYTYPNTITYGGNVIKENIEYIVPNGQFVLLGDNRMLSNDSRDLGAVNPTNFVSIVGFCYWNCQKN